MPEEFQSILLEDLKIEWPGHRIGRLALNQHMPRVEKLTKHAHPFCQFILYLRGGGTQEFGEMQVPVERGSLLFIQPDLPHSFVKAHRVRPVCMTLDLEFEGQSNWRNVSSLSRRDLVRVEGWLFEISSLRKKKKAGVSLQEASLILQILELFAEKLSEDSEKGSNSNPFATMICERIESLGLMGLRPAAIANDLKQSLDHINRQLREEGSPTAGQLIQSKRLQECQDLLRETDRSIGEVGSQLGMDDQNYFARWFRRQTGQSPTRWRESASSAQRL